MNLTVLPKFKEPFLNKSRYLVMKGGSGSGKSYVAAQKVVYRILSERGHRFLCLRKVERTAKQSVYMQIKSVIQALGIESEFIFYTQPMMIVFRRNGNEILFNGLDDPEKIKSIVDLSSIWMEEATEFAEEDFDQLDLRLRGRPESYFQIMMTFNPIAEDHWLKLRFFDQKSDRAFTHHSTYLDNPFNTAEYKYTMQRLQLQNPSYYKVYALGEWGTLAEGLIFPRNYYQEWEYLPADLSSVLYCDPNLALKAKGDTTGITELAFSPSTQKYYITGAFCQSFKDSDELLNTIIRLKSGHCKAIGFDGNVTQESTWTNHVRNWTRLHDSPFYKIEYKRYKVDDISKNINLAWTDKQILFPPGFREASEMNRNYLAQLFSFTSKKEKLADDAADSLICAFEFLHERKLTKLTNNKFKQPVIKAGISF